MVVRQATLSYCHASCMAPQGLALIATVRGAVSRGKCFWLILEMLNAA